MWNIRKLVSKGDYFYAVVPEHPKANKHGYVLAHRVIMENHIGRILSRTEEIHHKDGNHKNNSINNLQIMSGTEHRRLHIQQRYPNGRKTVVLVCKNCGVYFVRYENQSAKYKGYVNDFCSRKCSGKYNGHKKRVYRSDLLSQ